MGLDDKFACRLFCAIDMLADFHVFIRGQAVGEGVARGLAVEREDVSEVAFCLVGDIETADAMGLELLL